MTEATAPASASGVIWAWTAAISTPNLAKKPSIGGTPASDSRPTIVLQAWRSGNVAAS